MKYFCVACSHKICIWDETVSINYTAGYPLEDYFCGVPVGVISKYSTGLMHATYRWPVWTY
jgi:hypothetical protein